MRGYLTNIVQCYESDQCATEQWFPGWGGSVPPEDLSHKIQLIFA